jgi:mannose/cellobiose epimerase-like protein (N-acyl-D-glucosamine 2-epimerase family)
LRAPNAGRADRLSAYPVVRRSGEPTPGGADAVVPGSFVDWLHDEALPFWATDGYDASRARFCERLDAAGRPLVATPHRLMVQARQIFVFAHAANLGWLPEGAALAETAMDSLLRLYRDRPGGIGGFAFSVDADGAVVDDRRDTYGHAFVLFALAWLHRLNGDCRWLAIADETIEFMDLRLADSHHGGMFDAYPASERGKRQNPHMHLLEAYLALEETAPGRGYVERAAELIQLFRARMYRRERAVLPEHFAEDWSDASDPDKPNVFEPGHHFEWVWLLREIERQTGVDHRDSIEGLDRIARRHGFGADGLIFDEVAADYRPSRLSRRLWPHAEAVKAAAAQWRAGDPDAAQWASSSLSALCTHFVGRPFTAGWIDHFDADGAPLVDYVPASSLYHLMMAASEVARTFRQSSEAHGPSLAQGLHR